MKDSEEKPPIISKDMRSSLLVHVDLPDLQNSRDLSARIFPKMYSNISSNSSLHLSESELELFASIARLSAVKSYSTLFVTVIGILAFLANSLVLMIFLFRRHLITPFTVHVMAITLINLSMTVVYLPMQVSTDWKRPRAGCAFFLYVQGTLPTMIVLQHCVICIDRWLAYLIPHWYHRKRTVKFGVVQVFIAVVYLHLWYLPQFIPNIEVISRMSFDGSLCGTTWRKTVYDNVVTVMNVVLPEVFMYCSYPVLLTLIYKRRRARHEKSKDLEMKSFSHTHEQYSRTSLTFGHSSILFTVSQSTSANSIGTLLPTRRSAYSVSHPKSRLPPPRAQRGTTVLTRKTRLVMALLLAQMLIWTPVTIGTVLLLTEHPPPYTLEVVAIAATLGLVLLVLDPLFFIFLLPEMRKALTEITKQMISSCCHVRKNRTVLPA